MDYVSVIGKFMRDYVGGIYIKTVPGNVVVYADKKVREWYGGELEGCYAGDYFDWETENDDEIGTYNDFDQYDMGIKKFFLVRSNVFSDDGYKYKVVNLVDVSEAMELSRDMAQTARFFKEMDRFRALVIERLRDPYYKLLPIIEKYITGAGARIIRSFMGYAEMYRYIPNTDVYEKVHFSVSSISGVLNASEGDIREDDFFGDKYKCYIVGNIAHTQFALYGRCDAVIKESSTNNDMLVDNLRLYLENALMREEIIYESEHDKMTGLYNKGKYLARYKNEYQSLDSIGILNFDVNYLKQTNDTYGHEAGDELLKRAATSIMSVCTKDNIHGYRMGGDEYLIVIANPTKEEVDEVENAWTEVLARMNAAASDFPCIIAVGTVYGEKGYDFDELMHRADGLMYEDKKRKKRPGEEIR